MHMIPNFGSQRSKCWIELIQEILFWDEVFIFSLFGIIESAAGHRSGNTAWKTSISSRCWARDRSARSYWPSWGRAWDRVWDLRSRRTTPSRRWRRTSCWRTTTSSAPWSRGRSWRSAASTLSSATSSALSKPLWVTDANSGFILVLSGVLSRF